MNKKETSIASVFSNKGNYELDSKLKELPENFDYLLRVDKTKYDLILFTKDKIGIIELWWSEETPKMTVISDVWVDHNKRIDGHTKALFDVAEKFMSSIGISKIRILVDSKGKKSYVAGRGYNEIESFEDPDLGFFSSLEKNLE